MVKFVLTNSAQKGGKIYCMFIRFADVSDVEKIIQISKQYSKDLDDTYQTRVEDAINNKELIVVSTEDDVLGFVTYHTDEDNWTTINDLLVDMNTAELGVNKLLLNSAPHPIKLKCSKDNTSALKFYFDNGMVITSTENGSNGKVHELKRMFRFIFVQGASKVVDAVCKEAPFMYGVRSDYKPYSYPFMIDIKWDKYDWDKYIGILTKFRPYQAMIPDLTDVDQVPLLLERYDQVKSLGIPKVLICIKIENAVKYLPEDATAAISIPSRYAGYVPEDMDTYKGKRLHLLGGSPAQWFGNRNGKKYRGCLFDNGYRGFISLFLDHGCIVDSIDGNSFEISAKYGRAYTGNKWEYFGRNAHVYKHDLIKTGLYTVMERAKEFLI